MDFTVLEKSSDGRENVLVLTDMFTKFTQSFPTRDQKATTVAKVLVEDWFLKLGIPNRLHSDKEYSPELTFMYNVTPHSSTGYPPYFLMFDHEPRNPIDNLFNNEMTEIDTELDTYLANHQKQMTDALKTADDNIHKKASERQEIMNRGTDDKSIEIGFNILLKKHVQGRNKMHDN
ncbi:Hypothetical predicted protein [Mytilus galloprovincialis]|uniref:Integrase catalytic domain-containing protein n=1 Tax=Mytilus galloprovincialis TaxID=29158 RepID=A0A8B6DFZ5_MYTGA|nr:Hypothetical predicted protein [Mytilus galloprovincialis]